MWAAVGEILPIAVGVALSSIPIMAIILILRSPHARRRSIAFLVGWVLGLAAVIFAFTVMAQLVPTAPPRRSQAAIGVLQIVIGSVAVMFAFVVWFRSARPGGDVPAWLKNVGGLGSRKAFGLALLLNIRPKAVLLSAAGGLAIRAAALETGETVIVIVVYTVLSASTVAFPVIASLIAPEKTRSGLDHTQSWVTDNSRIAAVLVLLFVGVVIIGNGLAKL